MSKDRIELTEEQRTALDSRAGSFAFADALLQGATFGEARAAAVAAWKEETPLSDAAERAARSLAGDVRARIKLMPTTDPERVRIQARVAELLRGKS